MSDECCGFDPTMVGYLRAQRSNNAAEYISLRGRWAAAYTAPELRRAWLFVMRRRVDEPSDLCLIQAGADLDAEYDLRGVDSPLAEAADELHRIASHVAEMLRRMERDEPQKYDAMEDELNRGLDEYRDTLRN
jgi:hypothetical protein